MSSESLSFVELGISQTGSGKGKRYSLTERNTHLEEWRRSGLSMSEYCRRHGLATSSFSQWVKKLKIKTAPSKKKIDVEKRISRINQTGLVELTLTNGIRLRFSDMTNFSELVRLVKALESCN